MKNNLYYHYCLILISISTVFHSLYAKKNNIDIPIENEVKLSPHRLYGEIENFEPGRDQILLKFNNNSTGSLPAHVYLTYQTTLTWIIGEETQPTISLSVWNDNPIIVNPERIARSNIHYGTTADGLVTPIAWQFFQVWTNALESFPTSPYQISGDTSFFGFDLAFTPTIRKPANFNASMALGIMLPSVADGFTTPITEHNSTYKNLFHGSKGTLFYEVIGKNVFSVSKTTTYDRFIAFPGYLSGKELLLWFLSLSTIDQDIALSTMTSEQLFALLSTLTSDLLTTKNKDDKVKKELLFNKISEMRNNCL